MVVCLVVLRQDAALFISSLRHNSEKETLVDIAIDNGFIKEVAPKIDVAAETVIDANGKLVSPAFIDPHIHLDKVNIFDSCEKNAAGTLFGAIEMIWARKKNYTLEDILERS